VAISDKETDKDNTGILHFVQDDDPKTSNDKIGKGNSGSALDRQSVQRLVVFDARLYIPVPRIDEFA
jgi:hypothetical protein